MLTNSMNSTVSSSSEAQKVTGCQDKEAYRATLQIARLFLLLSYLLLRVRVFLSEGLLKEASMMRIRFNMIILIPIV